MNRKALDDRLACLLALIVATIIVLIPYHAFLTVWANSWIGHYTALRLWKEALLVVAIVIAVLIVIRKSNLLANLKRERMWWLVGLYVVFVAAAGLVAYVSGSVTAKAVLYGVLLDTRLFCMLFVTWVAASVTPWLYTYWRRLVLWPAIGVVAIGLLQRFVLPYDVMKHFGYNSQTISPYQTIDQKVEYIRIRSTLRGANLLGAYLIIILASLGTFLLRKRRMVVAAVFIVSSMIVLFVSGSRGAWLGAAVAAALFIWIKLPTRRAKQRVTILAITATAAAACLIVVFRNNDLVQNVIFHTDEHSTSQVSSNSAHVSSSVDAAKQIIQEPFGRGPGTAGPAGFYNTGHPARVAENSFLQIGQELGWVGLGLFIAIYALIAKRLWKFKESSLGLVLIASFGGLTIVGLLMHIWTDDTIAYLWFGLAGILFAQNGHKKHEKTR